MLNIIVLTDRNWRIIKSDDEIYKNHSIFQKRLKSLTKNGIICVGMSEFHRNNFQKVLGRPTYFVAPDYVTDTNSCIALHSIHELLQIAAQSEKDIFILGGYRLYKTLLPYVNKVYITRLDMNTDENKVLLDFDSSVDFTLTGTTESKKHKKVGYIHLVYEQIIEESYKVSGNIPFAIKKP